MKPVAFHPDALRELTDEALHFGSISLPLGTRFVAAVEEALALACEFPGIGSPYRHRTRRVFPKKFKFSVVYVERQSDLYVVAIAPFSRKPGYWRERRGAG